MSRSRQNGHGTGDETPLDDAVVEELLTRGYAGDDPGLVAVSRFFERVRAVADRPAPPASGALAQMLTDSVGEAGEDLPPARRGWVRDLRIGPVRPRTGGSRSAALGPERSTRVPLITVAAAVSGLLVLGVVVAGSARVLPGPAQDLVAKIVRAVTPFDFPEDEQSGIALSTAPSTEPPAPLHETSSGAEGHSSQHPVADGRANDDQPMGPDGPDSRPQPSGASQPLAPSTTSVPRAAPGVPEARGPSSDGVTPSDPPPPTPRNGLSADLRGATGVETAGDADGHGTAILELNRGRDEACLTLVASGIAPITSVHLHGPTSGGSGPALAAFTDVTVRRSCITVSDRVIKMIRKEPGNYYIDVHTTEFPNGALRGELSK